MPNIYFYYLYIIIIFTSAISCSRFNGNPVIENDTPDKVIKSWNDAINNRQWDILEQLYSDEVNYYSKKKTKGFCVKRKFDFIAKNEDYTQKVSEYDLVDIYSNSIEVWFFKTYESKGKEKKVLASLSLYKDKDNHWFISGETDIPTQEKNYDKICNCGDIWFSLFKSIEDSDESGNYIPIGSRMGRAYYDKGIEKYLNISYREDLHQLFFEIEDWSCKECVSTEINRFIYDFTKEKLYICPYETPCELEGEDASLYEIDNFDKNLLKQIGTYCK
jgi:hypothetical protein